MPDFEPTSGADTGNSISRSDNCALRSRPIRDPRTPTQIREHYVIEKELADRLRRASRTDRRQLYSHTYNELFRRVPHHPQLSIKDKPPEQATAKVMATARFLQSLTPGIAVFLEVGPGDCQLSMEMARNAQRVYAIDVSDEITRTNQAPASFQLVLSDGSSIPVPAESVDLAYSDQLMEHLHPEDARDQLRNIFMALKPGGQYFCVTPNRLSGPHDVSGYFDDVATGLHLQEYTIRELTDLFRQSGFTKICGYIGARGHYVRFPLMLQRAVEGILSMSALPFAWRRSLGWSAPVRLLLGIRLLAIK
jgi:SAM-dependent methyltransferase